MPRTLKYSFQTEKAVDENTTIFLTVSYATDTPVSTLDVLNIVNDIHPKNDGSYCQEILEYLLQNDNFKFPALTVKLDYKDGVHANTISYSRKSMKRKDMD